MNHSIDHSHQDPDLFGLLYGFRFRPGEKGEQIDSATALRALQQPADPEEFLWLHLNLAHAACERWMQTHLELPEEFFEALHEGSRSTRIEHVDSALLAVVNDVVFNFSSMVSSDISTLWVCARSRLLVSARLQPLHSVDKLRSSVKAGERFRSPLELLVHLLRDQGEVLTQIVRKTSISVDHIEDQLLSSRLSTNRAELGAGLFFVGYIIFEVPSNLVLERVGAKIWIARIMITWGLLSACTMLVTSTTQFYILRFLLGAEAERGFAEVQLVEHLQFGKADIDAVQVGCQVAETQERNQLPGDLVVERVDRIGDRSRGRCIRNGHWGVSWR